MNSTSLCFSLGSNLNSSVVVSRLLKMLKKLSYSTSLTLSFLFFFFLISLTVISLPSFQLIGVHSVFKISYSSYNSLKIIGTLTKYLILRTSLVKNSFSSKVKVKVKLSFSGSFSASTFFNEDSIGSSFGLTSSWRG